MATNAQPIGVIARLLDLSERRVQQLSREGVIPKAERGQYDLVGAVRGYVAYLRYLAVKAQAGAPDFGVERARLIKAKADIAEMEAEVRRGELLPAEAVEAAWTAVLARLRARLLVLPDRLAPLCHEETTIAGVRDQIRWAVGDDLVGFQAPDDLRSFRDYVVQELRDGRAPADGSVSAYGQTTKAEVFPIGVDPAAFRELAASSSARRYADRVHKSLGGCQLVLGVDRLDYSKGLPERVAAVQTLYERYPEMRGRVTFLQIASPSREDVPQYQTLKHELEGAVGQINGRLADSEWTPVRYVSKTYTQSRLCGLYRLSRVALVTPLRDGMNLVAKEYVAAQPSQDPGVLVLSRFAGAAHQMAAALIVNPYDKVEVCEAVHQALEMSIDERTERWKALIEGLEEYDLTAWRDNFLSALADGVRS